jgi:hypothetical protein
MASSGVRQGNNVPRGLTGQDIAGQLHLVAAHRLGERQRGLGGLDHLRGRHAVLRVRTEADADGQPDFRPGGEGEHPGRDLSPKPFGHLRAALLERMGQDHGELVAAETGDQVDLA